MKILLDMNLSPSWVDFFTDRGISATHWSTVGDPTASDRDVMEWAAAHEHIVFTHDLDFSALLAATRATRPSVLQIRTQTPLPDAVGESVMRALARHGGALRDGAIMVVEPHRDRVRILPL